MSDTSNGTLEAHVNSDVDVDRHALHHTLGLGQNQAASGNSGFWPGDLKLSGAATPPPGWLVCDGSVVSRTQYAALFNAISTAFNIGGEAGTDFRLPDLRDRAPVGKSVTKALGSTGGSDTHSHVLSDAGAAKIAIQDANALIGAKMVATAAWTETDRKANLTIGTAGPRSIGAGLIGSTDTATALPKYQAINYFIKT